jgi:hypothetical protein
MKKMIAILALVALSSIGWVDDNSWCIGLSNCPTDTCTAWNVKTGSVNCCCDHEDGYCWNYTMEKWSCSSPSSSYGYKNRASNGGRNSGESCSSEGGGQCY